MLNKQLLSSKIAVIGLLLLLLFLGDLKFRQYQAQRAIEKQELSLQQQADALQKKNDELNQSLQYLNSPDFKERIARENLDLKKNGETVYSFGQAQVVDSSAPQTKGGPSNPQKWWNYFFSEND